MKILFISLGCDKNLVDSEVMLGLIHDKGYYITNDETEADIIVINTCCFINDAKEESINTILEMSELKKNGNLKALIVTGCLAERYKNEIREEIEEVDAVLGTTSYENIVNVIEAVLEGNGYNEFKDVNYLPMTDSHRINTTGGYFSYLKIAEGCDKHCTYCIIPKIRGNYRSVPMEKILKEAEELAGNGVKELMLVAQETTLYGKDIYGEKSLPKLLRNLCKIEGLEWIRLLYCYPEEITDELIKVIKEEEKICKYIDMPVQHASDNVLKRMGRRTNKKELIDIIGKIRKEIPNITLRTTLITGFPGETEEDFEQLMDFVENMKFERLGVFTYSPEEGTPAADMEEQIDEQTKEERRNAVMEIQQEISFENSKNMIGKNVKVIIEGKLPDENVFIGRTYMDAPNVDGYIFVNSSEDIMSGTFLEVMVTQSDEYDLIGRAVYEDEE